MSVPPPPPFINFLFSQTPNRRPLNRDLQFLWALHSTILLPNESSPRRIETMGSNAPNWADQWGTGGYGSDDEKDNVKKHSSSSKMADAKAKASAGMDKAKAAALVGADKAKAAAVVGAMKVKSGTSAGLKWVKNQYQKRSSSSK